MATTELLGGRVTLHAGDCLAVLATLPENSVDSCVCDPPYHLTSIVKRFGSDTAAEAKEGATGAYRRASAGFMGKRWDGGDVAFQPATWAAVARVLKPGGYLLAFSGARTYHRMAVAIEDAGFDIRDQIGWAYGSGFPKSHNQMIDDAKWGTALKPAWEPIVVARKAIDGTNVANWEKWGVGLLNIDGCRVEWEGGVAPEIGTPGWGGPNKKSTAVPGQDGDTVERIAPSPLGRWPANLIHDGSDEVLAAFPETASGQPGDSVRNSEGFSGIGGSGLTKSIPLTGFGDSGSAARFFYTAKADANDRLGSGHPTIKPLDLMQYLVRLVTPPGGLVLDPFAGTGTTGEAAFREGMRAILIEREAEYQGDIARRMELAENPTKRAAVAKTRNNLQGAEGTPLFG